MNTRSTIFVIVIIFIAIVGGWFWANRTSPESKREVITDYKDATYVIEGKSVTLVNGYAETPAAPGSDSKTITQYFGNEATGDLNNDGVPDVAFILTQNSGGSGTFYYIVAALKTTDGYQGTNAVLLGDRIAPQTTQIKNDEVVVNYADRASGEPMTAQPSVGMSMYLKVEGMTLVAQHLNADAYPLYNALSWGPEQPNMFGELSGYETISSPITDINNLSAVSMPFDAYYKNKLETAGWTVDNTLAAGGPGSSITAYKKGNEYLVVSYTTKFKGGKPNEPVQCPCDITFSVFSGVKK